MIDYHIRLFDPDYVIPNIDFKGSGLQDTWKLEKIPAITLHGEISILASVPAQECLKEYFKCNGGEVVLTNL